MNKDIRSRVHAYHTCALSKPAQNSRLGLLASEVAQRPTQKIFIDYVGKLPRSKAGNSAILVCVDAFSKFVWLIPVRQATNKATIKALQERIFSSFSVPDILAADNAHFFYIQRIPAILLWSGCETCHYITLLPATLPC